MVAHPKPSSFSFHSFLSHLLLLLPLLEPSFLTAAANLIHESLQAQALTNPTSGNSTGSQSGSSLLGKPAVGIPRLVSFTGGKGNYRRMAREFLTAHNTVRAQLNEQPFVWDRRLARFARRWSERRRADCNILHSMGPYGENMFWGSGWSWRAADAVKAWAREAANYNSRDNTCTPGQMCGHFTQIIWKSTISIGCGRTECYSGGVIITCSYNPPGNYIGESPLTVTA